MAKMHRRIRAAFPSEDLQFTSLTRDGTKGVAVVLGDRFRPTFYLVDLTTDRRTLKAAGNPVEVWHVEPREGHGFGNQDNRREMYTRMLEFFESHIGRGADAVR